MNWDIVLVAVIQALGLIAVALIVNSQGKKLDANKETLLQVQADTTEVKHQTNSINTDLRQEVKDQKSEVTGQKEKVAGLEAKVARLETRLEDR